MADGSLGELLEQATVAVQRALEEVSDWRAPGRRPGQYAADLVADEAATRVLTGAGLRVLSEESGFSGRGELLAVLDPLDGSTNASRGIPWFATSICVLDKDGPLVSRVTNLAYGTAYCAERRQGAFRDGRPIRPARTTELSRAFVALSGYPRRHLGWRQYRVLGAAALDLCCVADGSIDAYFDCDSAHGVWDYLGAALVCSEAGAEVKESNGEELVVLEHEARRAPIAGASAALVDAIFSARTAPAPR